MGENRAKIVTEKWTPQDSSEYKKTKIVASTQQQCDYLHGILDQDHSDSLFQCIFIHYTQI